VTSRIDVASAALAMVAAAAFALWLFPPWIVDTADIRWLMDSDPAQHFLGWHFFRNEPWQWPPGAAHRFGEAMGNSIVYTDSIPLVALALKPLSAWLPARFQYAGWWMVACYALAAGFAWRCARQAGAGPVGACVFALLAASVPFLMVRSFGHYALMGHWLIWWGFALHGEPDGKARWWPRVLCLCVAVLVHAYLGAMVLAVLAADIARRWIVTREFDLRAVARGAAACVVAVLATTWLAGYFEVGATSPGQRYGEYGANLNTFWNPTSGSTLLPAQPLVERARLEGSAYLGAGCLALLAAAIALSLQGPRVAWDMIRRAWPLWLSVLAVAAIAVTHRVTLGDREIALLPWPAWLLEMLEVVRGSGRLAWVVAYALLLWSAALVFRRLGARGGAAVLAACLGLQVVDQTRPWQLFRGTIARHMQKVADSTPPLEGEFWTRAAARYRRVALAPMEYAAPGWIPLGLFAADHGLSINSGQFARASWVGFAPAYRMLEAELAQGMLRDDTLYVIVKADVVVGRLSADDGRGRVDGFDVIAPGWFRSESCCLDRARSPRRALAPCRSGETATAASTVPAAQAAARRCGRGFTAPTGAASLRAG
jgi:hypothetical protein